MRISNQTTGHALGKQRGLYSKPNLLISFKHVCVLHVNLYIQSVHHKSSASACTSKGFVKSRDNLQTTMVVHQYSVSKHTSYGLCTLGVKICVHYTYIRMKREFTFVFLSTWTFLGYIYISVQSEYCIPRQSEGHKTDNFLPLWRELDTKGKHDGDWFSLV